MAVIPNRVVVLSDVHGVLPAPEAVLAEPEVRDADAVVTGDIAAGPQPVEVLDALTALGDRVILVRGNADRELLTPDSDIEVSRWAAGQLRDYHRELITAMPEQVVLSIPGPGDVLFCHATPRDDTEVVLVDSRVERWDEVFFVLRDVIETVVCGHTHMPFARIVAGRMVVNPGSVGMPYGRPGAHRALLGPGITLRRTEFDHDTACDRISAESDFPGAAAWADEYVRARNLDVDALAVFGPMDGRVRR